MVEKNIIHELLKVVNMFQILQKINLSYFSVWINLFSNYFQRNGKTIGLNTRMCMIYIILNILQIVIVSYMFTT